MRLRFARWGDLLLVFGVCLIAFVALLLLGSRESGDTVTVYRDNEAIDRFSLSEQAGETRTYQLEEGSVTVRVEADGVSILSSDCPNQSCIKKGRVSRSGDAIVCLPMRFSVVLDGESEYDGVTE